MTMQEYLDKVLVAYTQGNFYDEVKKAKQEYFQEVNQVAEGSEKFELQMKAFLDWFLFDRPLENVGVVPVKLYALEKAKNLPGAEKGIFEDLCDSRHSLFELLKVKDSDIYVKDLFNQEKYIVEDSEVNLGFSKGDIFESRLIRFKDRLVFGNSFLFHPPETRKFILRKVKEVRYLDGRHHLKLIHKLASMRLKTEQYPHIAVENIYTETPLF